MKMKKSTRGFGLMEVLIGSVIAALMATVFAAVLKQGQDAWRTRSNTMTISFELRRGMQSLTREIAQTRANQLSIPADGNWYNTMTLSIPQDMDGNGTVLDGAGVLEWSNPIQYALGGVNGQQVQRIQAGNTRVLAHGVTLLRFRRAAANPSLVEINFSVQRGALNGNFIQQVGQTARVRVRN